MTDALVDDGKHAALDGPGLGVAARFASVHDAQPDASGSGEISGGSPPYSRQALTWADAAAGVKRLSNSPVFDIPDGATVAYIGMWSDAIAGRFFGYWRVEDESFVGQGIYTLDTGWVAL